jgi:hypothetical protein
MITMNNTLPTSFPTKAAQKELLDSITRQYETLRNDAQRFILNDPSHKVPYEQRSGERYEKLNEIYWGLPNYPHQVREKHYAWFEECGIDSNAIRGLVVARDIVKKAPVIKAPKVERSEGKRTERSATHRGCCQLCGKAHKIDVKTGLIADHGYTLQWGWQSGSCAGSHHFPIEKSKALVEKVVVDVAKKLDEVQAEVGTEHNKYYRIKRTLNFLNETIANWKPRELTPIKYDN